MKSVKLLCIMILFLFLGACASKQYYCNCNKPQSAAEAEQNLKRITTEIKTRGNK